MKKFRLFLIMIMVLLMASVCMASDVTLSWDANSEPDIAGYRLYKSLVSGEYSTNDMKDVGNVTTCTFTGLPNGTYYFVATAYNEDNFESDYSNEVFAVLDVSKPLPPTNNRITLIIKVIVEQQ